MSLPVVEFLKLQISEWEGNWPLAHPHSSTCFSAWQESKQAFEQSWK